VKDVLTDAQKEKLPQREPEYAWMMNEGDESEGDAPPKPEPVKKKK
jgi:hypothetical protein